MGAIAFQITSLTIVYSTVYSSVDQRKHQSSASLAFVRGIHRWPENSLHKWPVTRKMFPFDDVIMNLSVRRQHKIPGNEERLRFTCHNGLHSSLDPRNLSTNNEVHYLYLVVTFLERTQKRHRIARPQGRGMGCIFSVYSLSKVSSFSIVFKIVLYSTAIYLSSL